MLLRRLTTAQLGLHNKDSFLPYFIVMNILVSGNQSHESWRKIRHKLRLGYFGRYTPNTCFILNSFLWQGYTCKPAKWYIEMKSLLRPLIMMTTAYIWSQERPSKHVIHSPALLLQGIQVINRSAFDRLWRDLGHAEYVCTDLRIHTLHCCTLFATGRPMSSRFVYTQWSARTCCTGKPESHKNMTWTAHTPDKTLCGVGVEVANSYVCARPMGAYWRRWHCSLRTCARWGSGWSIFAAVVLALINSSLKLNAEIS